MDWTLPPHVALIASVVVSFLLAALWMARPRLPERAVWLGTNGSALQLAREHVGGFMLLAFGTYALNQVLRLLILLERCGLQRLVGSILIVENEAQLRQQFAEAVPPCYRDRIVYGFSENFSGGYANAPVADVLASSRQWGSAIEAAAEQCIDLHLRRNASRSPGVVLAFWSLGGQAVLGLPASVKIAERFAQTLMVGFTSLPVHQCLRDHLAELKVPYERSGVYGWVISDNLSPNPDLLDTGMVAFIEAMADAALAAERSPMPNNALRLALRKKGSVLVYQVALGQVVAFPSGPFFWRRFFVHEQPLFEQLVQQLQMLEEDRGLWSLTDLPIGETGAATFDILLTGVGHQDLARAATAVTQGRELQARLSAALAMPLRASPAADEANEISRPGRRLPGFGSANYETLFASLAAPVAEARRAVCPVLGVRLACLRDTPGLLDDIVKAPHERRPRAGGMPAPMPAAPLAAHLAGPAAASPASEGPTPHDDAAVSQDASPKRRGEAPAAPGPASQG